MNNLDCFFFFKKKKS